MEFVTVAENMRHNSSRLLKLASTSSGVARAGSIFRIKTIGLPICLVGGGGGGRGEVPRKWNWLW